MKRRVVVLISLILIVCISAFYAHYQRKERIRATLAYGQLASLPPAATHLEVDTKGGSFSRTFWLTFQATDTEIDEWLTHSPTLTKISAIQSNHQPASTPAWFTPQAIHQGRGEIFRLVVNEEAMHGTVWIDRQTKTVYIKVSHS